MATRAARKSYESVVLNALRRITQALRVAAVRTQSATGISAAQLFVLSQLETAGAHSIGELAEATLTDRSSVADVVDRLVEQGLVARRPSATDRRRAEVQIRAAGRKLLRRAPQPPTMQLMDAVARLNAAEVQGLAVGLSRLSEELGASQLAPGMLFEPKTRSRRTVRG